MVEETHANMHVIIDVCGWGMVACGRGFDLDGASTVSCRKMNSRTRDVAGAEN